MKVMVVIGTRPEAIKMAPVIRALDAASDMRPYVVATAQHRGMLDDVLDVFDIRPDVDLDIMRGGQTPTSVAASVLMGLEPILERVRPDWVLVQGDTTTVLAAAIAAHYARCGVGHVEAGLRSHDRANPFPEESNRAATTHLADLHFAPTETARENLLLEGVSDESIHVTGNPVIDALRSVAEDDEQPDANAALAGIPSERRLILVTAHRRENHGAPIRAICAALEVLADRPDVHLVYPVHPNPNIGGPVHERLAGHEAITLLPPVDYRTLVCLMKRSELVLTDSGGIQEEAPGLGKPVLVLRSTTERPEAVAAGTARLVGTDPDRIVSEVNRLLDDATAYDAMVRAVNPYGDGFAAGRIVVALRAAARPAHVQ